MDEKRETKQIIVMRKDLNMRKGKMVAQGAHASLKALLDTEYLQCRDVQNEYRWDALDGHPVKLWLEGSFTKVCVGVNSEAELVAVFEDAGRRLPGHCPMALITDAGRTEFNGVPTVTCCAIGPWWADEIDAITGELKLL